MAHDAYMVFVPSPAPQFRDAWGLSSESVAQFGNVADARAFKQACEERYNARLETRRVTVEIGEVVE